MSLRALIADEATRPAPREITALAAALAGGMADARAVLFYGSCLRDCAGGVLDFYILTGRPRSWRDRVLPPSVHFAAQGDLRAKVAVMAMDDFARAMRPDALSPHLWARFCQPVRLVWCHDDAARDSAVAALAAAIQAAAFWAESLSPNAPPEQAWHTLFATTYASELRAESADRPARLVAADAQRWRAVSALCFSGTRRARRWGWRRPWGKALAAARLVKAAFTFAGGADYLEWKIARHTGVHLGLTPWQRRHPLLAALLLLPRLRRRGLIR